jgi:hypothetical protein
MPGQLFPDYVECAFLTGYRCQGCGRTGEALEVSFPTLAWLRDEQTVLISYPVRCRCGKNGLANSKIPFLLFCFVCGWLEYQGAARHQPPKSPQKIRPSGSTFLLNIFYEFERVMSSYGVKWAAEPAIQPWNPGERARDTHDSTGQATEQDRALFGASPKVWREFLRRLGLSDEEGGRC